LPPSGMSNWLSGLPNVLNTSDCEVPGLIESGIAQAERNKPATNAVSHDRDELVSDMETSSAMLERQRSST